jgi:hypothetical protein
MTPVISKATTATILVKIVFNFLLLTIPPGTIRGPDVN